MGQKQLFGEDASSSKPKSSGLMQELEQIQAKDVVTTRRVKLKLVIGCGCGGNYEDIEREVPINSKLKDGDYVSSRKTGDKTI